MMEINTKSIFRALALSLLFSLFSSVLFGQQQWGVVEKSNETKQIGNKLYFLHKVAAGNTFYSLARVYGVTAYEIKAANPELEKEVKLGTVILIPKVAEKAFSETTQVPASSGNYFYHVVKQGESLFGIARIFGVKVNDLLELNGLRSPTISPGFHLKIPEMEIEEVKVFQNTKPQKAAGQGLKYFEYTVKRKETLFSIAKRYGIGIETLKYINNFSRDTIYPGQIILIPKAVLNLSAQEKKDYIIHKTQPKEGLYGIARKYGISINQIKAFNPGLTEAIAIGQQIKIPRTLNKKGYIEHRVASRKEKLSDIAREYEISVRNLKKLNPDAPAKVRRGKTIFIPVDFIDQTETTVTIGQPEEEVTVEPEIYTRNRNRVFKVALMLPLYLDEVDSLLDLDPNELLAKRRECRSFRFLEFYEGAQIAVDSLRQMGMQLVFKVYDVNDDEVETALLLHDPDLRSMDLIISLLFSRSFAQVSSFSKEYRIPLVNVLSKRRQIIYENPYVFKVSPKSDAMYNQIADFVGENLSDFNTIIVRNNPYQLTKEYNLINSLLKENIQPKAPISNTLALKKIDEYMEGKEPDFLQSLHHELVKGDYSFGLKDMLDRPFDTTWVNNPVKTVVYSIDSLGGIMEQASLFRDNLIVALGSDEVFAIELFTKLNYVRDSVNIKVIGLPDWHNYMNLDVDYSQPFSLRVTSEAFVDYNSADVNRFIHKFQKAYHKVPEVEAYSFLGYDATFYFLQALYSLGNNWMKKVPNFQIPLLQNQLKFERQNRGGFENTYWNFYRQENYSYKIEK